MPAGPCRSAPRRASWPLALAALLTPPSALAQPAPAPPPSALAQPAPAPPPSALAQPAPAPPPSALAQPAPAPPTSPGPPAPPAPPPPTTGVERPASEPGDAAREVARRLLYIPRKAVDFAFVASGNAAGLIHNEQVVPRIVNTVAPEEGRIGVFPTAFAETRNGFNVGARMIANLGRVATGLRAGFGGLDSIVIESRVRVSRAAPIRSVLSLEVFHDRRTDLSYLGVGQEPREDPRNAFLQGNTIHEALYRERRSRAIASLGLRPIADVEIFLSAGLTMSLVEDSKGAGAAALSRVFAPQSTAGAFHRVSILYNELAFRLDTREYRGRPSPGGLVEVYGGLGTGINDDPTRFLRLGGRAAAFQAIGSRANILSPKLVIDGIVSTSDAPIPFIELARQPEFRGINNRRDRLSVLASLDYRWMLSRYIAARLFVDGANVFPDLGTLGFKQTRFAYGLGVDVSSSGSEIGQLAFSMSPEGVRLLVSLGVASFFGDRQHRD